MVSVLGVTLDPPGIVEERLSCSIQDFFNHKRAFNTTEAFIVVEAISLAVLCFHKAGFVHRDIYAGNVLLKLRGQAVVAAKLGYFYDSRASDVILTQADLGTVAYVAPELLLGDSPEASTKADIFSLGVLFWGVLANIDPSQVFSNPAHLQIGRISSQGVAFVDLDSLPNIWKPLIKVMVNPKDEDRPQIDEVVDKVRSLRVEALHQFQPANTTIEFLQKRIAEVESANHQITNNMENQAVRIAELEKDKASLEQSLTISSDTISTQYAQIASLESVKSELEKRIVELESRINNVNVDEHPSPKERIIQVIKSLVDWNNLSDDDKEDIWDEDVSDLNLLSRPIGPEGAIALALALETHPFFHSLNLDGCNIGPEGAVAFARVLETHPSFDSLNLDSNNIRSEGASAVARALETNSSLLYLDLRCNNIGSEGVSALARALETNSSLSVLNLHSNNIGFEGAIALASSLETNSSLSVLSLFANNIGPEGTIALARALETNSSLSQLYLAWNNIGPEGAIALARALETNSVLSHLDLGYNNIGNSATSKLKQIASKRRFVRVVF
ncbi:hypothetical protein P9112_010301 [Eukaryota sp. TZLM1-RC]